MSAGVVITIFLVLGSAVVYAAKTTAVWLIAGAVSVCAKPVCVL